MRIKFHPVAFTEYKGLPPTWQGRIRDILHAIRTNPLEGDHMYLERELYCSHRVRVDDFRVVYRVFPAMDVIAVIGIGHKPVAYHMAAINRIWGFLKSWRKGTY